jgi:hypothetical protein
VRILSLGQSLPEAVPDLEELLAEPLAYLQAGPLAIAGVRLGMGAAWCFFPGLLIGYAAFQSDKINLWAAAIGSAFMLAGLAWLAVSWWLRGRELVLHPEGVEVVAGRASVWVPWAALHVPQRAVVRDVGGVVVPLDPAFHQAIEQRLGRAIVQRGRAVRLPGWHWLADDEVRLGGYYDIRSGDLVDLLRFLARHLGDAPRPEGAVGLPPLDSTGWFVVPANRLRLPPCCAGCAGPRDVVLTLPILARGEWWAPADRPPLEVPLCEKCKTAVEARQRRGAILGAVAGLLIGTLFGLFGAALGIVLGMALGFSWARRLPVRLRRYSPSRGVVSVRFAHQAIGRQTLEPLRHALPEE